VKTKNETGASAPKSRRFKDAQYKAYEVITGWCVVAEFSVIRMALILDSDYKMTRAEAEQVAAVLNRLRPRTIAEARVAASQTLSKKRAAGAAATAKAIMAAKPAHKVATAGESFKDTKTGDVMRVLLRRNYGDGTGEVAVKDVNSGVTGSFDPLDFAAGFASGRFVRLTAADGPKTPGTISKTKSVDAQHTPGPLHAHYVETPGHRMMSPAFQIRGASQSGAASHTAYGAAYKKEDAILWAAAPDLLAALKKVAWQYEIEQTEGRTGIPHDIGQAARAAILRATGGK
jgi:hypothetical protein